MESKKGPNVTMGQKAPGQDADMAGVAAGGGADGKKSAGGKEAGAAGAEGTRGGVLKLKDPN